MTKAEANTQAIRLAEYLVSNLREKGIITPTSKLDMTPEGNKYIVRFPLAGKGFKMIASLELIIE